MACGTATRHLYHRGVSYESISYFRLGACPAGGGAGGRRHVPLPPRTALLPAALLSGGGPHRPPGASRSHRSHGTPGDSRAEWGHRPHWPLGRDRYAISGRDAGAIAVIGPTRMNYAKLVSGMEYLADAVGRMLTELLNQQG